MVAKGQAISKGKRFNPTTGKPQTEEDFKKSRRKQRSFIGGADGGKEVTKDEFRAITGKGGTISPETKKFQEESEASKVRKAELEEADRIGRKNVDIDEVISKEETIREGERNALEAENELIKETPQEEAARLEDNVTEFGDDGKPLLSGRVVPVTGDDLVTVASIITGVGIVAGVLKFATKKAVQTGVATIARTRIATTSGIVGENLIQKGAFDFTQRAFRGKPAASLVNKIFTPVKNYAVNGKSLGLTTSWMAKAGMTLAVASLVGTAIGTYPFAEFELAEATDKIGIAMFRASQEGDTETVQELQTYLEDMLDESSLEQIISVIPFANVLQNVKKNIEAARKSAEVLRELAENERG